MNLNCLKRWTFLFCFFAVSTVYGWDKPTLTPGRALIFPDNSMIVKKTNTTRSFHQAQRDLAPVLQKDRPWEQKGCHVYGSVYKQADGTYRMWYNDWSYTLVADSRDGKTWTKPDLTVNPSEKYPKNNMCKGAQGHCVSVVYDKFEKDPSRRYKHIGCGYKFNEDWSIDKEVTGYYGCTSADGLTFTGYKRLLYGWDTVTMTQNPETGEIFVYHKINTPNQAGREDTRRIVYLTRTFDFIHFSKPEVVLAPDEADDEAFTDNPNQRVDFYTHTAFPYAGGFVGFTTIFKIDNRQPSSHGETRDEGFCDVQLTTSPDGIKWCRTPGRKTIVTVGAPGAWDCGGVWGIAGGEFVTEGDETSIYYYGLDNAHGRKLRSEPTLIATGRAYWRRWGFSSIGSTGAGSFETKPVILSTEDLRINMKPEFDPFQGKCSLKVTLLSANGKKVLCESENLDQDDTLAKIVWKDGKKTPVGKPVRIRVDYHSASIYAFECL